MSKSGLKKSDIALIDKQIGQLLKCEPLSENEVKGLCKKVGFLIALNNAYR